ARVEALAGRAGLPIPDALLPLPGPARTPEPVLQQQRIALERALRLRGDWAEGHLRLGLTLVRLYEVTARRWIASEVADATQRRARADPVWLLGLASTYEISPAARVEHDPIRLYLIPATRSFLEARRCCPLVALAHAELAVVSPLLARAEP